MQSNGIHESLLRFSKLQNSIQVYRSNIPEVTWYSKESLENSHSSQQWLRSQVFTITTQIQIF